MLQCLRLSVAFGDTLALDAVNLTVHDGEIVAVMGPSGCGKSTLLRSIAGLQMLDVGTVTWDGRNDSGESVPGGVYFYRLESSTSRSTRRVVLAR